MTDACETTNTTAAMPVWSSSFWRGRALTGVTWCWHVARHDPPWGYRAVNLGLHLAMTALVGLLAWTLTASWPLAGIAAAIFGVNAVHVEAVAYLSSRSELIAGLGVVTACLAALTRRWWLVGVALLAGIGGKETTVVGLMLVPLCLWWQHGRPWGLVTALGTTLVLATLLRVAAPWWGALAPGTWVRVELGAMARVLLLTLVPLGQTVDYDYARVPAMQQMVAIAVLGVGLWTAWQARPTRPLVWFGACWIGLTLLPRLVVPTPLSVFAEHQLYLPVCGVAMIVAALVTDSTDSTERPVWQTSTT